MTYADNIKRILFEKIDELDLIKSQFLKNPDSDFSRTRKLDFSTMVFYLISMEAGALKDELFKLSNYDPVTPTASAFVQQRNKIDYQAFEYLFHSFNSVFKPQRFYKGYRLLAIDGSTLPISYNPNDLSTYVPNRKIKGHNNVHINALYDILSMMYTDIIVHPGAHFSENGAYNEFVDRYDFDQKSLFIADRGYESFNSFEHVVRKGQYFLTRVKDIHSSTSILKSFILPDDDEFDVDVNITLTRRATNYVKENRDKFKWMPQHQTFDFFDDDNPFYDVNYRVLRFKIGDSYESIITNLSRDEFTVNEIKELYHLRWGIETSFKELKYAVNLNALHAKKVKYIYQEIFARVILYNFCQLITTKVAVKKDKTKYAYQINFTRAIHLCRKFLKSSFNTSLDIIFLISKELLPVRPGRKHVRNMKNQRAVSFTYRFD